MENCWSVPSCFDVDSDPVVLNVVYLGGDVVQDDPENVVLDIERVVGRSKNKSLVERLRVVIVRLKTTPKKKTFSTQNEYSQAAI